MGLWQEELQEWDIVVAGMQSGRGHLKMLMNARRSDQKIYRYKVWILGGIFDDILFVSYDLM